MTGVPGSGKTTLGRALAEELGAAFISLDEVKEELWAGSTWPDGWSLRLAAEADVVARARAASDGAVIDVWVTPGRDDERVASLLAGWPEPVVQVACVVPVETAVSRYVDRGRTGGPHGETDEALLARIRDAVPLMATLGVGPYLEVDTAVPVDVPALATRIRESGSCA